MHAAANQLHGKGSLFTPFVIVRLALRCPLLCLFLLPRAQKIGNTAFCCNSLGLPESAASFSHMNARTRSCSTPLPVAYAEVGLRLNVFLLCCQTDQLTTSASSRLTPLALQCIQAQLVLRLCIALLRLCCDVDHYVADGSA